MEIAPKRKVKMAGRIAVHPGLNCRRAVRNVRAIDADLRCLNPITILRRAIYHLVGVGSCSFVAPATYARETGRPGKIAKQQQPSDKKRKLFHFHSELFHSLASD
jgi:hypothetical protein